MKEEAHRTNPCQNSDRDGEQRECRWLPAHDRSPRSEASERWLPPPGCKGGAAVYLFGSKALAYGLTGSPAH